MGDNMRRPGRGRAYRPAGHLLLLRSTEPGIDLGSGDVGRRNCPHPPTSRPTIEQRGGLLTAVFSDRTDDGALAAAVPDLIAKGVVSVALRAAPIKDFARLARMNSWRASISAARRSGTCPHWSRLSACKSLNLQFLRISDLDSDRQTGWPANPQYRRDDGS